MTQCVYSTVYYSRLLHEGNAFKVCCLSPVRKNTRVIEFVQIDSTL